MHILKFTIHKTQKLMLNTVWSAEREVFYESYFYGIQAVGAIILYNNKDSMFNINDAK